MLCNVNKIKVWYNGRVNFVMNLYNTVFKNVNDTVSDIVWFTVSVIYLVKF